MSYKINHIKTAQYHSQIVLESILKQFQEPINIDKKEQTNKCSLKASFINCVSTSTGFHIQVDFFF